jgi:uncharacterized protein (TIGR03790 family)
MIKGFRNFILLLALFPIVTRAANPGDEVVLVYNSRMPESKNVADHYAELRHVPTDQIFGMDISTNLEVSRFEFRDHLQKPLAEKFEKQKLWHIGSQMIPATTNAPGHMAWVVKNSKIRYLVLCYGIPVRIAENRNLKDDMTEKLRPELRRNVAAVDSELALLPSIEQHLPLDGPLPNSVYASTNTAAFHPTNGVLMVTRLDGPSSEIARGLVDKAIEAESNGWWGYAYFDLRGIMDVGYKPGDDILRGASDFARNWGFEVVMDTNAATFPAEFPMSHIGIYCGWYDANVSGPLARPNVEFMPGAFAYHLHSFSAANLRSANQNWTGPLLAKGATISMGSVDEPYLSGTPDVAVFLSRFTYFGFNYGEAATAAQSVLSWQTTIVGDPLYRPTAIPPPERHAELEKRHSKWIEWSFFHLVNLNLFKGTPASVMSDFLEKQDATKHSAVLTEKLGDLYAAQGKPSSAVETYEVALKLDPSPQQKVRLRLTLADKLTALDKVQQASDELIALLQENQDYPNKLAIYRKLLDLARKQNKADDITKYERVIANLAPPSAAQK